MDFTQPTTLGRTGLQVGRLGIASGYWAPAEALELAFEHGCNYFTWGTFIRGRSPHLREAVRRIVANGQRDRLVLSMFSYAHQAFLTETLLVRGLRDLGIERADVLVLGYFSRPPGRRILDGALRLKEKGLVRFIGLSGHNRRLFGQLRREGTIDLFHIRYSAVHSGAEQDAFPELAGENRPGVVAFTAAAWGKLVDPSRMPGGETPPRAADCYRFALSHPSVDVCMVGARSVAHMREDLEALRLGPLDPAEMARMRRIGDHIYGKPRRTGN
jgi:aryl-alcohol dehydrogenase-like predicted oxidoreductase